MLSLPLSLSLRHRSHDLDNEPSVCSGCDASVEAAQLLPPPITLMERGWPVIILLSPSTRSDLDIRVAGIVFSDKSFLIRSVCFIDYDMLMYNEQPILI